MTILDASVVIEKAKRGERIEEDITAITLVEYPKIIYYKKFLGSVRFSLLRRISD